MRRFAFLISGLALVVSSAVSTPTAPKPQAPWPQWLERWLFNPTERTDRAVESSQQGEPDAAVEPLETALRLAGDDPEVLYNAGAARLGAGQPEAESLLEAAAVQGDPEIASLARYNQGNARLATDDFAGAIEAYQQALRQNPAFEDAKHNLELARRRLEEQQQQQDQQPQEQQQDQPSPQDQSQSGEEPQDQDSPGPPPPSPNDSESQESGSEQNEPNSDESDPSDPPESPPADGRSDGESKPPPDQPPPSESPLPQFQDLPDMSAEEAAAILEAIENMEREQRRRDAQEAAAQPRTGEKDW